MRDVGWLLVVLGVCLLGASFFVTTSTHTSYTPSYSIYVPSMPSEVANLYGMHLQMALIVAGVGSVLTGTVAIAADAMVRAINQLREAIPRLEANRVQTLRPEPDPKPEPEPEPEPEPGPELAVVTFEAGPEPDFYARSEYEPDRSMAILVLSVVAFALVVAIVVYLVPSRHAATVGNDVNTTNVGLDNSAGGANQTANQLVH